MARTDIDRTQFYTRSFCESLAVKVKGWAKNPEGDDELICSVREDDHTPSCRINPRKGTYFDFGRGGSGKETFISELCKERGVDDPFPKSEKGAAPAVPRSQESIQRQAARELWEGASEGNEHPYLLRKKVEANGTRRSKVGVLWKDGALKKMSGDFLIVPSYDPDGSLVGLEQVTSDGKKYAFGSKGFHILDDLNPDAPLILAEGFATAASIKALSGANTACCFGAANFESAVRALRKVFPGEIVVAPDAGTDVRIPGVAVVELPSGSEKNDDWNDLHAELGIEDARAFFHAAWDNRKVAEGVVTEAEDEAKEAAVVESPATSFALQRLGDIPLVEPRFLVEDLFECDALCLFFGESGCKKSFVAIDLAASIATGAPWNRKQTKEGVVIYLAGEGGGGLPRRARAWEIHRGISLKDAPLFVSNRAALFMDEHGARIVENEVDRIAEMAGSPVLIVVDTIARSMVGGDENSAKDTSIFVERIDALRRRYGASALLIHHSGLSDKGRLRGSSAWKGALEAEYLIEKSGDLVTVTNQKMKDAPEPAPFSFESVEYVVLETATGKEITSLALEPTDEKPARVERISAGQKRALDSFYEAAKANPILDEDGAFLGVHVEDWRGFFYETATAPTQSGKRQAFNRAVKELVEAGHLTVKDDVFSPTSPADTLIVNQNIRKMNLSSQRDSVTERDIVTPCNAADDDPSVTSVTHSYRSVTLSRSPVTLESETGVDVGGKPVLENELGAGLETPEQKPKTPYLELLKGDEHDADTKVS